jgi:2-dehydropantoate 2-reductase
MSKKKSIAVIGAGAIGGITAAFLNTAGYDVQIVCKHEDKAQQARETGLHITGIRGEHFVKMNAVADIEQLSGKKDYILIVTKTYDMPDAAKRALAFAHKDTVFVSMQNGICVDAMRSIVGKNTVGCVIGWGSTMQPDGTLNMTSEGEFVIGGEADLTELKQIFSDVMPTRVSANIINELYSKMIVNACITSMGVLSGLGLGVMLKSARARNIFIAVMKEAMQVADAMKLTVPPFANKLDYYSFIKGNHVFAKLKRHALIRIIGFKYRRLKSSSLSSLKRGKPTEIDYFNGFIADKGRALSVPTPLNSRIVVMIKEIEQGKRSITPKNFNELISLI